MCFFYTSVCSLWCIWPDGGLSLMFSSGKLSTALNLIFVVNIKLKRWTKHEQSKWAWNMFKRTKFQAPYIFHHSTWFTLPETKIAPKNMSSKTEGSSSKNQLTGSMICFSFEDAFIFQCWAHLMFVNPPKKTIFVNFISFDSKILLKNLRPTMPFSVLPRSPAVSERHHRSAVGRRPVEKMAGWLKSCPWNRSRLEAL